MCVCVPLWLTCVLADADSARTDEAVSLAGSSRDEHEQSWKCAQFEDFIMSPLEIGMSCIS